MENLKKFAGLQVKDLSASLKQWLLNGFEWFNEDEILEAQIQSWEDFRGSCSLEDGTESPDVWKNTLNRARNKEKIKDNVFVVEVDIFDLPDVAYESHSENRNIAIVNWGEPVLIYNADCGDFGMGYIIIEDLNEHAAYLEQDLCSYKYAKKIAKSL